MDQSEQAKEQNRKHSSRTGVVDGHACACRTNRAGGDGKLRATGVGGDWRQRWADSEGGKVVVDRGCAMLWFSSQV